jgi:hypothetical protein
MREMIRASISMAARRAASSICSQVAAGVGVGFGSSNRSRFNCIVALLARRRLGRSGAKSVDEFTQSEQIADFGEIIGRLSGFHRLDWLQLIVGPTRWNQRSAAVWQNGEQMVDATSCDGVDQRQRPPFEGMAFARYRRKIRNIMEMGSLWRLPSTRFRMIV